MSVEYYVEDGNLFVTQTLERPTPTVWYRTTEMSFNVFPDFEAGQDRDEIAWTGVWWYAKYYKNPMNSRSSG